MLIPTSNESQLRAMCANKEGESIPSFKPNGIVMMSLEFAAQPPQRFDVLFLDPPYGKGLLDRVRPHLSGLLTDDAVIYCEAEQPVAELGDFRATREGRAGQVHYQLLERS